MSSEVVAITGASAGVGRAAARAFAARGYDVGLIARGLGGLEAALKEVESEGQRGLVAVADVSDAPKLDDAASRIEETLGPIDVWVNNAMISVFSEFRDFTPEEFRRVTEVTYLGVVHGTMSALKRMLPRDRGVIVQVGSALAYRAIPLQSAYCGAKHAMKGFTESLRTELLHEGSSVRVTMVQLPALNTPQFDWSRSKLGKPQPIAPIYQPEVAADAILWAAEHPRREILVGAPTRASLLGQKLFPGSIDRYLAATGYQSQQSDEPASSSRRDNLDAPLDDESDFGAHGRFDRRSRESSLHLWSTRNLGLITAGAAASAGLVWLLKQGR